MKFISWNVNGLRACVNKGFLDNFYQLDADFFCLQETKLQEGQIDLDLPGYHQYWCYAEKKGYSGTAIFTKHKPLNVYYGLGVEPLDTEGRLITLEYQEFYLVNCYTPNAQRELARIDHRMAWEDALRAYLTKLDAQKPVIYCGDLNVAHREIDLKNPSSNRGNAGFSDQERNAFSQLLSCGFTDSFRYLYPDATGVYSWWSYMFNARKNNAGWRIDYFVVSDRLRSAIAEAAIHSDILGSDHCPVELDLDTTCNGSIWSPDTPRPPLDNNSTDKESPVGAVKAMLTFGIAAVAILAIVIGGSAWFKDLHSPREPEASKVSSPPVELIADVWYPTEQIELIKGTNTRFKCGSDVWFPVEPVVDLDSYDRKPTFCAVITFGENTRFTKDNLPQVQYQTPFYDRYFYKPYLTHQFFYGSNGQVAGCLLLGDVPEDDDSTLIVQHAAQSAHQDIHITAERDDTDYSQYTTRELVEKLSLNPNLSRLRPDGAYGTWIFNGIANYSIEYFVNHTPAAAELLEREDAVDTMFRLMDAPGYTYTVSMNILVLLQHDAFYSQMTPEQSEKYQQHWQTQYGYLEERQDELLNSQSKYIIIDGEETYIIYTDPITYD